MKKLLSKPKIVICILAISIIGLLTTMSLSLNWQSNGISDIVDILVIKEFIVNMAAAFIFLSIGAAYMNYEGSGTPRNIAINLGFHAFLILTFVSLILLIRVIDKNKKAEQEIKN